MKDSVTLSVLSRKSRLEDQPNQEVNVVRNDVQVRFLTVGIKELLDCCWLNASLTFANCAVNLIV